MLCHEGNIKTKHKHTFQAMRKSLISFKLLNNLYVLENWSVDKSCNMSIVTACGVDLLENLCEIELRPLLTHIYSC